MPQLYGNDYLIVGLDCGGTKCRARLVSQDGTVLGEGIGGASNGLLGLKTVFREVEVAVKAALTTAGLEYIGLAQLHAGLGLAGLNLELVQEELADYVHPFASLVAATDSHIAQLGAHAGGDGAILIIGTGSCGYALFDGDITIKGGNGFKISDHGSGAQLGYSAVRRALLGFENILPNSELCRAIMMRFDHSIDKLVAWSENARPTDYGSLTPLVFDYAERDDVASSLIRRSAEQIDMLISSLVKSGAEKIVLIGGMSEPIFPWLSSTSLNSLAAPKGDALDGAILLSKRAIADQIITSEASYA